MQNFDLLKELGKTDKPILLKRGLANTLKEFLMSAEYIMSEGNEQVILCERGIRTYETYTRNTLDLSAVPTLKNLTHLPVVVDPSHATGKIKLIPPMALAAVACGADGVMVEVHNDPLHALCDGAQSLKPDQFADLAKPGLRYVNRQKGSGTRILTDYLCARENVNPAEIYGYDREELTHTSVAAQIVSGSADAGMGIYSAAKLYDLDFIPICIEEYDLLIPDHAWETPMVRQLIDTLKSPAFREKILALGGYTVENPGEIIDIP